mmetsp:Transcript_39398/g.100986  ORF Transcript_39398/g.100986 Transcript_39398/m.100986 type:complete len:180 (-) Transcript_39398:1844-2383(-)
MSSRFVFRTYLSMLVIAMAVRTSSSSFCPRNLDKYHASALLESAANTASTVEGVSSTFEQMLLAFSQSLTQAEAEANATAASATSNVQSARDNAMSSVGEAVNATAAAAHSANTTMQSGLDRCRNAKMEEKANATMMSTVYDVWRIWKGSESAGATCKCHCVPLSLYTCRCNNAGQRII